MEKDLNQLRETLVGLLQNELACATALLRSLESESAALSSLDEKLITINSANKQKLIESLQQASSARINLMDDHGLSSNPAEIEQQVNSSKVNTELNSLFTELSQIAQQCFTENRLIGQLINRRTQFISRTLDSLSPTANPEGLTYGESGKIANTDEPQSPLHKLAEI